MERSRSMDWTTPANPRCVSRLYVETRWNLEFYYGPVCLQCMFRDLLCLCLQGVDWKRYIDPGWMCRKGVLWWGCHSNIHRRAITSFFRLCLDFFMIFFGPQHSTMFPNIYSEFIPHWTWAKAACTLDELRYDFAGTANILHTKIFLRLWIRISSGCVLFFFPLISVGLCSDYRMANITEQTPGWKSSVLSQANFDKWMISTCHSVTVFLHDNHIKSLLLGSNLIPV